MIESHWGELWSDRARYRLRSTVQTSSPHRIDKVPRHRRYVSDSTERREAYLKAAEDYVARQPATGLAWLHRKPFDDSPGHPAFFDDLHGVMNLLRAMAVTPGGRILEVGCGPGWVTEILVSLGYEVAALDPSEEMLAITRDRVARARAHYGLGETPRAELHLGPLETCALPDESFDAVFLHAALHHVVDEESAIGQCFRLLRPGGVLGVSEAAWIPGDRRLEEKLDAEMRDFGTLENPFTVEYLDYLLHRHGFREVQRFYAVNGLFPASLGASRLARVATSRPADSNNLTARRPSPYLLTTLDGTGRTEAEIRILRSTLDRETGAVRLRARLKNRGETTWLAESPRVGWVSIALRHGEAGAPDRIEAERRHRLPCPVQPREEIAVDLSFRLPPAAADDGWFLDLVNEERFWFSTRGTTAAAVRWE